MINLFRAQIINKANQNTEIKSIHAPQLPTVNRPSGYSYQKAKLRDITHPYFKLWQVRFTSTIYSQKLISQNKCNETMHMQQKHLLKNVNMTILKYVTNERTANTELSKWQVNQNVSFVWWRFNYATTKTTSEYVSK